MRNDSQVVIRPRRLHLYLFSAIAALSVFALHLLKIKFLFVCLFVLTDFTFRYLKHKKGTKGNFTFSFTHDSRQLEKLGESITCVVLTNLSMKQQVHLHLNVFWPRHIVQQCKEVLLCRTSLPWRCCEPHKRERGEGTQTHFISPLIFPQSQQDVQ